GWQGLSGRLGCSSVRQLLAAAVASPTPPPTAARGRAEPAAEPTGGDDQRRRYPVAVGVGLLALAVGGLFRDFNFDDAYIVARYAENVAAGRGWVFNPGEPHNGA